MNLYGIFTYQLTKVIIFANKIMTIIFINKKNIYISLINHSAEIKISWWTSTIYLI